MTGLEEVPKSTEFKGAMEALETLYDYDQKYPKEKRIFDESQLTDVGNAKRLVKWFGKDIHYVSAWRAWMHWNGRIWERLDEDRQGYPQLLKEWAKAVAASYRKDADVISNPTLAAEYRKHAKQSESDAKIRAMLNQITGEDDIMISYIVFDTKPFLFTCQNGTLNLETGKLQESKREDYSTKISPVTYDPDASCPLWTKFMDRIMDEDMELVDYLQNLAGQCLTGEVREKAFYIFWGAGGDNGKSTFIEGLKYILNEYGQTIAISALIKENATAIPVDLHSLRGARFVFASEPDFGDTLTDGLIKRITGKDTMKTRMLYEKPIEWDVQFKLVIATNSDPNIKDASPAMWNRVKRVPFLVSIPLDEQDKSLGEKFKVEASGILNWMLEGCRDWLENGMVEPKVITESVQEYRESSDILAEWIDYTFDKDVNGFVPFKLYYPLYKMWCHNHNQRPFAEQNLPKLLGNRGYVVGKGMNETGVNERKRERGVYGLKLQEWLVSQDKKVSEDTVLGQSGTSKLLTIFEVADNDFELASGMYGQRDREELVKSIQKQPMGVSKTIVSPLSSVSEPLSNDVSTTNTSSVHSVHSVYKEIIDILSNSFNKYELKDLLEVFKTIDEVKYQMRLKIRVEYKGDDLNDEDVNRVVDEYLQSRKVSQVESQEDFVRNVVGAIKNHQNDSKNGAELDGILSEVVGDNSKIIYGINKLKSQGEIIETSKDCYKVVK